MEVHWEVKRDPATPYPTGIEVSWIESGGPPVRPPAHEGFGSRLLRVTSAELKGKLDTNWARDGLEWRLSFPLRSSDFDVPAK